MRRSISFFNRWRSPFRLAENSSTARAILRYETNHYVGFFPVIDAAILGWPRAPAPSEWSDVPTFYPIGAAIAAAAATTTTMPEADHVTWLHDDDVTLFSSPAPQARSGRLDSCK